MKKYANTKDLPQVSRWAKSVKPGRIIEAPYKKHNIGSVPMKNMLSNIAVYNIIAVTLAADNFSRLNTKSAAAEPPTAVGDTAELNSQININWIDLIQENTPCESMRSRNA